MCRLFPGRRQDQASRQSSRGREHRGHSQSGQQPLKAIRQMPQFSSLATQSQVATPFQHLIFTFMAVEPASRGKRSAGYIQPAQLQHLGPQGSRGSGTDAQAEKSRGVSEHKSAYKVAGTGPGPPWEDQAPQERGSLHFQSIRSLPCIHQRVHGRSTIFANTCHTVLFKGIRLTWG